jgi:mannosyltransferase
MVSLGLFSFALLIRFIGLGQEAFFIDEVVTSRVSNGAFWEFVRVTETSPPLFLLLMKGWMGLFGTGHIALRSFSAIAGSFAAPLIYIAALQISFRRFPAIICGLWMAIAPLAVWHSQQARYYGLLSSLVALYFLCLFLYINRPGRIRWVVLVASIFIGFSEHYYFVFIPLSIVPWVFMQSLKSLHRSRAIKVFLAHVVGGVFCLVYLPLALFQWGANHTTYIPTPRLSDLGETYISIFFAGPFHQIPDALKALIITCLVILPVIYLITSSESWQSRRSFKSGQSLILLSAFAILPVILPFLMSLGEKSFFLKDRYTIVALPGFILLIGYLLNSIKVEWLFKTSCTLFSIVVMTTGLYFNIDYYTTFQDFDWRGAIKCVESDWSEGDQMIFSPRWMKETYVNNGGRVPSISLGENPSRYWMIIWEQNPNEQEMMQYQTMIGSEDSLLCIDFPHIKLWRISSTTESHESPTIQQR